jgi:hypothetical protein
MVLTAFIFLCFDEERMAWVQRKAILFLLCEGGGDGSDTDVHTFGLQVQPPLYL